MTVRSRAPLRIDFAGGWSDVADFADMEGGTVVNAAVGRRVHVDFLLGGQGIHLVAEDLDERAAFESSAYIRYDGKLDLHKAALNLLPVTGGIEILSRSDAPPGSGLGGSGSLDVALLAGLAHCRQEEYEPAELAELGFMLESGELGLLGGKQDQYAAALGGFNRLDFSQGDVNVQPLSIDEEAARDLARHTVLVYTGKTHFSSQTHARVWESFHAGESRVIEAIRGMRDAACEVGPVLEAGGWRELASLVDDNWRCQQLLDATMFTPATREIDAAVRAAGCWGLKATGAGAGGCLVVLCPLEKRRDVAAAARACGSQVLDFEFTFDGVSVWQQGDAAEPR
jgi:D-glycero-alpha-D-manno-heptose-7-phosphate kinase